MFSIIKDNMELKYIRTWVSNCSRWH